MVSDLASILGQVSVLAIIGIIAAKLIKRLNERSADIYLYIANREHCGQICDNLAVQLLVRSKALSPVRFGNVRTNLRYKPYLPGTGLGDLQTPFPSARYILYMEISTVALGDGKVEIRFKIEVLYNRMPLRIKNLQGQCVEGNGMYQKLIYDCIEMCLEVVAGHLQGKVPILRVIDKNRQRSAS